MIAPVTTPTLVNGEPSGLAAVRARIAEIAGGRPGAAVPFAQALAASMATPPAPLTATSPAASPTTSIKDAAGAAGALTGSARGPAASASAPAAGAAASVTAASVTAASVTAASVTAVQGDWAARLPAAARPYLGMIQSAADATGVDPRLIAAVAWTESNFSPRARSGAGAQGIMQIMPATARGLGVDPYDPAQAIMGGARYLATELQRFGGRQDLAAAAYNAGPSAVLKHGGVPPYAETQKYVQLVLGRVRELS